MSDRDISITNLVKNYPGDITAVDRVFLSVDSGEIFGFLGPNGAGKSTTVKILTTLALPTDGSAIVGGYDVLHQAADVRRISGVALQEIGLDPIMKPRELLTLQGQLFNMSTANAKKRADELLELVDLTEAADRRVGTFSGGMKRRLDLALALVHDPKILFLDEPTTGLDPASRRSVWKEVRRLNRELGMTIFLTTQYLEEADELADNIAIINEGKIAAEGSPEELKSAFGEESINIQLETPERASQAASQLKSLANNIQNDRNNVRIYLTQAAQAVPQVINALRSADLDPVSLTLTQPTLDDVFLQVTGSRIEPQLNQETA
ncbi:MAG: ATP-binding cassette domain-containing protein [Anaerolineales bacterium]|jgi:ABC-2 type transport system ATP-binding protein